MSRADECLDAALPVGREYRLGSSCGDQPAGVFAEARFATAQWGGTVCSTVRQLSQHQ